VNLVLIEFLDKPEVQRALSSLVQPIYLRNLSFLVVAGHPLLGGSSRFRGGSHHLRLSFPPSPQNQPPPPPFPALWSPAFLVAWSELLMFFCPEPPVVSIFQKLFCSFVWFFSSSYGAKFFVRRTLSSQSLILAFHVAVLLLHSILCGQ